MELMQTPYNWACPICGGPVVLALPNSPYSETEMCCLECGYVDDERMSLIPQDRLDSIVEDLEILKDDIWMLGAKPLDESEIAMILTRYLYQEAFSPKHRLIVKKIAPSAQSIAEIEALIRIKTTKCTQCGKPLEYTTKKPKLCPKCKKQRRQKQAREAMRQLRSKRRHVNTFP